MKKNFFLILMASFFVWTPPQQARGENSFYREADDILAEENIWTRTIFRKNDSHVRSIFRVWYPCPASQLWEVLTDTNHWKDIHSEYNDSRTLSRAQFDELGQKRPKSVKDFYEIVGESTLPSFSNRVRGGVWTSYIFQRFNFPWPLIDRWLTVRVKNDESKANQGIYHYEYKMSVGNFKESKGYWELVPIRGKEGWTEFRGEYRSDPGVQVPHILTRAAFRATMKRNLKENMAELEKTAGDLKAKDYLASPDASRAPQSIKK